jgi:glyoxylase-like metal-dependent hydrolase (beta-lactamase superfamily II)
MCYLVNDKYLFTGDALSLKNDKIDEFNNFFNMDSEMALKSIEKIKNLNNIDYIFTAHYGYSDNFQKAISEID